MQFFRVVVILLACFLKHQISGHGMLWDPPNRSSMFRFGFHVPPNYNDNQNFCGGFATQQYEHGGKCGICGDNYADPTPRNNEDGGLYGTGLIGKTYSMGAVIPVVVKITAAHKGYFTFGICDLSNGKRETDECFQNVLLADGSDKFRGVETSKEYAMNLKLPAGLRCERCVLRWKYTAGNNFGQCADGSNALGCGPQETFMSCSDISIR